MFDNCMFTNIIIICVIQFNLGEIFDFDFGVICIDILKLNAVRFNLKIGTCRTLCPFRRHAQYNL